MERGWRLTTPPIEQINTGLLEPSGSMNVRTVPNAHCGPNVPKLRKGIAKNFIITKNGDSNRNM